MTKYTITIDVESDYDIDKMDKKIFRLNKLDTFVIKRYGINLVEKFDQSLYDDILSEHVNETPNNIKEC